MTKYLSYKNVKDQKFVFKIHSSDQSKTWWADKEPNLNFITVTEDDFNKLKRQHSFEIDESNQLVFETIDSDIIKASLTKDMVEEGLNKHIAEIEDHLKYHAIPLCTQTDLNNLNNINLDGITWPVSCTLPSWVEALEINSISVDFIFEV